ncbi:hypothetical protein [Mameliella alba]|uniref:Uncharacterized protein n=1 Tax=Mameliella alba TaxID=561184 RepID=A0A0B3RUI5_9RHOB|nr:hypothetical protein [Mameliella alba]KHQ50393.1 hypothetical protein OA50_05068 [Mameliella alba]
MAVALPARTTVLGLPNRADNQIDLTELAALLEYFESLLGSAIGYYEDDLADLPTASGVTDGSFAVVLNDATVSNRGVYQEQSDAWVKVASLPAGFSTTDPVVLSAAGTADAIEATANRVFLPAAFAETFSMQVAADNTGPVTVEIDGGTAYALVRNDGTALGSGEITDGMVINFRFDGTSYRLTGPGWTQALADASDAAQDAASAAASSATAAASDASDAADSAATASAAAAAAGLQFDHIALTKAAADTWTATATDGEIVLVLVDEEQANQITVYEVASSALGNPIRTIGDQTLDSLFQRYGYVGQIRNTLSVAARIDRDKIGPNGPGNPNQFPNAITASQSGTTITASGADFRRLDAGMMVYWDADPNQFARILDVDSSSAPVTSVPASRSQTVSSAAATVDVKPLVFCFQGDSLGIRLERALRRVLWRSVGFGGLVRMPAQGDHFIDSLTVSGGASIENTSDEWDAFPTGSYWNLPVGGDVTYALFSEYALGNRRAIIPGLSSEQMRTDTFTLVWRRGAGSIRIDRRRVYDPEWETVETIADTSTGSTSFNFHRAKHDLSTLWEYRVVGLSGTVKVAAMALTNEAEPGWVSWDMSRGSLGDSKDLKRFADNFPASDLRELWEIFNADQHIALTADPADDVAAHLAYIEDATALWDTATGGRIDHVWLEQWDSSTGVPDYAEAARQFAVANGHTFIPFLDLFGDYATQIRPLNLLQDLIHPGNTGMEVMAWQYMRLTGLTSLPVLRWGQDVRAQNVDAVNLSINGRDVKADMETLSQRAPIPLRGATWSDDDGVLSLEDALSGDLGTSDFTFQIAGKLKETASGIVGLLKLDSDNTSALLQDGGLSIYQESRYLKVDLSDGSGNVIGYDFEYFTQAYDEIEGVVTIRSDVANGRFDLFWNGLPAIGTRGEVTGTTTSPLGTWSGTGTEVRVAMGPNASNTNHYVKGIGFWSERLSDEEIANNAFTGWYETEPEWFWAFDEGAGRAVFDKTGQGRDGFWLAGGATPLNADGPQWLYPRRGSLPPLSVVDRDSGAFKLVPNERVLFTGVTLTTTRTWTLPETPQVGDMVELVNAVDVSTYDLRIGQAALHQIKSGASSTTIGTGGYIQFGGAADRVRLVCSRAQAGVAYEWIVAEQQGAALTFT